MQLKIIVTPPIMENCYILHNESKAIVFDPGGSFEIIKKYLEDNELLVEAILLTHGHFDHIMGVAELKEYTKAPLYVHKDDLDLIKEGSSHAAMFGLEAFTSPLVDIFVEDGYQLHFKCADIKVIHTPGHSKGGVCYYDEKDELLISGDTIFLESIGRTDLPGGDFPTLAKSIKEKIYALPPETVIYPGHGNKTSVGFESEFNPYVKSDLTYRS